MTKRQHLCWQRRSRPEQSDQRQPNQAANISHQPRASPNSTSLASRIEFPTLTGVELAHVARHALFDLLLAALDLALREVVVATVHGLELAAVDGNAGLRQQAHLAAQLDELRASALTKGKSSGAPMSARTFWSLSVERPAIAQDGASSPR